ncbi:hypothetical protein LCGC14_1086060 [marine sediment metagenome]|uniref:Uncharacterized protein n=1 Tax=marine sediment metagenome TaxID=412755 RepID=A0A0F9PX02_9ZZZZ
MTVDAHASGTIKLNSLLYDVARNKKGDLQYNHRSGTVERGLGLWEHVAFRGGGAGMGYAAEGPDIPDLGFYYSQNCMTILPRSIGPGPTVTALAGAATKNIRDFFEEKADDGQYYLYACGVGEVTKIKLEATPSIVGVETASFESTDLFGRAVRAADVKAAFQADAFQADAFQVFSSGQWILPPDSGDRIIELTRVQAEPTSDTWVVQTDVVDGASHFVIAGRNFWRAIANSKGTKISACDVLNSPVLDNSWGGKFPFGEQGAATTALIALHRFIFAVTQSNIFGATEDFNASGIGGAVSFSEMLPDTDFTDEEIDGAPVTGLGSQVWDASLIVPTPFALYRHDISAYERIGPDAFPHNDGVEPNLTDQIRFGRHRGVAGIGSWLYKIYEMPDGDGFYILAGRKRVSTDGGAEPLVLQPIVYRSTGRALVLHPERNGTGAPRLWWGRLVGGTVSFEYISLGLDGGPYKPGGSFGDQSVSGTWFGKEFDLDAPGTLKSMREVEIVLDGGDAELSWQNQVQLDGAAAENVGTVHTTTGGTKFFAAQKKARRIRPVMVWTGSGSYTATGNASRIRKAIYRGHWLPEVADRITLSVDVLKTAQRRGTSPKKVRDELAALALVDNYPLVDIHGSSAVQVIIEEVDAREGGNVAGLEGREMVHLALIVHELS